MSEGESLKLKTARSVKWNLIDRVGSQILYAITGIILANLLSQEDFGLVGAVLVFQAFASLLIDSGFASALIQRKAPSRLDYSSVMWFNFAVAVVLYVILWFCAPLIADIYKGDTRIIALSRVLFVSLIINAGILVQANILMKKMDVGKITFANFAGLLAGAVVGIYLAFSGYGAWAIVWQTLTISIVKTSILWLLARWLPLLRFSWTALRSYIPIASRMMLTSFLNTLFQNIYSLVIGNRVGMVSLGYYTQGDKWSKMSITTISQTITASAMPALSEVQDDYDRFKNMCSRFSRFTAYILFPLTFGPVALATPAFHLLFGDKWDASVILFQLLILRGVFTVLNSVYNNFLLARGHAKAIVWLETLRDALALAALAFTIPCLALSSVSDPVCGLRIMLYGQLVASALTWTVTLTVTSRMTAISVLSLLKDLTPYLALSLAAVPLMLSLSALFDSPLWSVVIPSFAAIALYILANCLLKSKTQSEALNFILGRKFC